MRESSAGGGARLLVVDDNKVNRLLLSRNLELLGHRVAAVENGRVALETLRREPFDLALLDIEMPEMDGFQVLEQIRGDLALRDVPVIVTSSLALRSSWAGYRMQALLDPGNAAEAYRRAWMMEQAPPELATEIAHHFMQAGDVAGLKSFVDALPARLQDNERIVLARAVVAADEAKFDELERLLMSRQFASIREGETILSDLWVRLRKGRLETELGRPPASLEVRVDLAAHPLPAVLDLRMHVPDEA